MPEEPFPNRFGITTAFDLSTFNYLRDGSVSGAR
jgi:hypothetical protein